MNEKKAPPGAFQKLKATKSCFAASRLSSVAALRGVLSSNTIP